jgi:DNA-binding PadR family transcriptional regulator
MHRHCRSEFFEYRGRHRGFGRHGFRGFGLWGGPRMRPGKMLGSEELQLVILSLLSEKPRHGYEIIKALEEHSSGIYVPSPGMVYPALTYLEELGYTSPEAEGNKKLYKITETGAEYLKQNKATADEALDQLARVGRRVADFQKQYAAENEAVEDLGANVRHRSREEQRQILHTAAHYRELRDAVRGVLYEKLDAAPEEIDRISAVIRKAIDEIRGKSAEKK